MKREKFKSFGGIENDFNSIKDRWFHLFGSLFLEHDIQDLEDLWMVLDHLIEL